MEERSDYYRLSYKVWDVVFLQILKKGFMADPVESDSFDELFLRFASGRVFTEDLVSSCFFNISGRGEYLPLMLPNISGLPIFRRDVIKVFGEGFASKSFFLECDDRNVQENYFLIHDYLIEGGLSDRSDFSCDEDGNVLRVKNYVLDSRRIGSDVRFFGLSESPGALFCSKHIYDFFNESYYSEWGVGFWPVESV